MDCNQLPKASQTIGNIECLKSEMLPTAQRNCEEENYDTVQKDILKNEEVQLHVDVLQKMGKQHYFLSYYLNQSKHSSQAVSHLKNEEMWFTDQEIISIAKNSHFINIFICSFNYYL